MELDFKGRKVVINDTEAAALTDALVEAEQTALQIVEQDHDVNSMEFASCISTLLAMLQCEEIPYEEEAVTITTASGRVFTADRARLQAQLASSYDDYDCERDPACREARALDFFLRNE